MPAKSIAPISNAQNFKKAIDALDASHNQMLLVFGPPGLGKTVSAAYYFSQYNGLLIRCLTGLSQKALLRLLLRELGETPKYSTNGEVLLQVLDLLSQNPRPIFIDEADRLFERKALFESVRDIHDQARVPVIMLGASSSVGFLGVDHHLRRNPQMADRIVNWLRFKPADKSDLQTLLDHYVPDLQLTEGLSTRLLNDSQGNIRRIREGIRKCKDMARRQKTNRLDESMFGLNALCQRASGE